MEINISKSAAGNSDWQRNEWGQHGYTERSNHCNSRPFEKNNKPKHTPLRLREGKKKNAQYTNVKYKTENDQMKSSDHTSEIKASIQSAGSLTSHRPQQWQCMGKCARPPNTGTWQGRITQPSDIFYPFRKNNISKNGVTSSVLVFRSLKWYRKDWDAQEESRSAIQKAGGDSPDY